MNIGVFTDSYYPEVNGVVTSVTVLCKELKKLGHNVFIFTTSNPLAIDSVGSEIYRLPSIPFIFLRSRRVGLFYDSKIANTIKNLNLDIIHTHTEFSLGIFGKIMAEKLRIPIVHTYHTLYKDYAHYISKGKFKRTSDNLVAILSKNFCNKRTHIIVPTRKIYDLLKEYCVVTPMSIIPSGINLDTFDDKNINIAELVQMKSQLGIGYNDPVIVFIGRIAKEKSIDVIINKFPQIINKVPNCKFLLVGEGPSTQQLQDISKNLGIEKSVIFTGEQPANEIHKFYKLANVFVSASVTETQGLTFIEAMASGIPVVAKNDKSLDGLILNNYNGLLFDSEDKLENALVKILTDKTFAEKIIANAKQTVKEYSSEEFGKKVEKLYVKILHESPVVEKCKTSRKVRTRIRLTRIHLPNKKFRSDK